MAFSRKKSVPLVSKIFVSAMVMSFIILPSHQVSAQYLPSSSRNDCDVYGRTAAEKIISAKDKVDSMEERMAEIDDLLSELKSQKRLFDSGKVRPNDLTCNCNAISCSQQLLADLGIPIPPLKQVNPNELKFIGWRPPVDPICPKTYSNSIQGNSLQGNSVQGTVSKDDDAEETDDNFANRTTSDTETGKDPKDPAANLAKQIREKCHPLFSGPAPDYDLDSYGHLKLCTKIYEAGKDQPGRVISTCWDKVTRCGQMAVDERIKRLDSDIASLQEERNLLKRQLPRCLSTRDRLIAACPNCAHQVDMNGEYQSNKPHWSEIAVGMTNALMPGILGYMGNRMASKYMNTSLSMYNSYLDSNLAGYQAQVNQCITLGIPCGPYQGVGGYSGFSLSGLGGLGGMGGWGGMGFNPMMGMGGFNPMMGGGIGLGIGMGGGMNPFMSGGLGIGLGMGMGMNPMMGMGMNPMMGMGGFNPMMMGGMGMNPMMGMGMNPFMGGMGMNPFMMGMGGMNGGYGMGMVQDPTYLLQMQQMGMDQRNMMIAQQQMMEAQFRYQQMQNSMYSFGGGGMGYNPWMMNGGMGMGTGLNIGLGLNLGGNLGFNAGNPWAYQTLGMNGFPGNGSYNPFMQ